MNVYKIMQSSKKIRQMEKDKKAEALDDILEIVKGCKDMDEVEKKVGEYMEEWRKKNK